MNIFIVYAHPEPKSYNGAMKNLAVEILELAGHEVQVSDLYQMKFNPIGAGHDFDSVAQADFLSMASEQMNASIQHTFSADIQAEQAKLLWADLVIFQFPLWWFSMPAMMKGWIDRVLAYGFAYGHIEGVPQNLKGRKALCVLTTGATEESYSEGGAKGPIEDWIKHIQIGMLSYTGFEVQPAFVVYQPEYISEAQRIADLERYSLYLHNLVASLEPVTVVN